jgi:patatin-related protein
LRYHVRGRGESFFGRIGRVREKELRIALVCFGGVSLAIYMHGITKEILKLARASGAVHGIIDRAKRRAAHFFDVRDENDPEHDTEAVYFDVLRDIGRTVELRVIVDIIAGASAGGINATMLARALSHDLPMGRLRDLWLEKADVTELLAPEAKARRWSKWFLRPVFWAAGLSRLQDVRDREVRTKLSLVMRSRWFKPPFDGLKMAELMYDGLATMGTPRSGSATLLPSGQRLDLFVTVTDFHGCQQLMQIHDPPVVHEREHRHVLHFAFRRHSGGAESDFGLADTPALAFAARATSSLPGAFPPARIVEMDELMRARGVDWPRRGDFLARNFEPYARVEVDAASVPFVDGSVLNSRPFRAAIAAIRGRPAFREVDRRLVYIDPNPAAAGRPARRGMPGFFTTLKGALSDIPLSEPVTDELSRISRINEQARRLRGIIDSARPHISRLVEDVMSLGPAETLSEERIRGWRAAANNKAARDAGFAYEAYVRLKLAAVRSFLARLVMDIRGVHPRSPFARAIAEVVDAWAIDAGVAFAPKDERPNSAGGAATPPGWITFLLALDVDYRRRRLHFLIEGQNRLYQMLGAPGFENLDPAAVDGLKRWFYDCIEALEKRVAAAADDPETRGLVDAVFRAAPAPAELKNIAAHAQSFAQTHKAQLDRLVERIGTIIDLQASTRDLDVLLAETEGWPRRALHEVLVNFLGFPFWDVLTLPVMPWREAGEFNEIRIDRISAQDAAGIAQLGAFRLKGAAFNQFAAFLSRAFRENDYLLGRLHAADRLIDIVCDAAGADALTPEQMAAHKRNAVLRILAAEEPHLPTCKAMIAQMRAALGE